MIRRPARMTALLQAGGPFTGDNKPTTRITVEPGWYLNTTTGPVGNMPANKLPLRWWQEQDTNGTEVEIPNLKTVIIDRSLNQDADTIEVDFYNTATLNYGVTPPGYSGLDLSGTPSGGYGTANPNFPAFGERGFLAPFYGDTPQSTQIWGQTPNSWNNVLRENSLLRVYQGYGGWVNPVDDITKTITQAINDGSIMLTGVFLVDTVAIEAQTGLGKLVGRSMAKLLIDQPAWPPLVPAPFYTSAGINYYHDIFMPEPAAPGYGNDGAFTVPTTSPYATTASNTVNYTVVPGDTLWAIAGKFYGDPLQWPRIWNANLGLVKDPNLIYPGWVLVIPGITSTVASTVVTWPKFPSPLHPWNKTVYDMAVMPDGRGYRLAGSDGYVYNYNSAAILGGFVTGAGGAALNAKIVSIENTPSGQGYWLLGADGSVFTFGDAQYHGRASLDATPGSTTTVTQPDSVYTVVTGDTLWAIAGRYYGNPFDWPTIWHANTFISDPNLIYPGQKLVIPGIPTSVTVSTPAITTTAISIRRTPSGHGYWICGSDGRVYEKGDAPQFGNLVSVGINNTICGFAVRPQGDGYWLLATNGDLYRFGNALDHGNLNSVGGLTQGATASAIDAVADGNGYRCVTSAGGVFDFGSAQYYPLLPGNNIDAPTQWDYPAAIPMSTDPPTLLDVRLNAPITGIRRMTQQPGFYTLGADGSVYVYGPFLASEGNIPSFWFGALPGTYSTNLPGNYTDYADIVSDFLLWSGFYLQGATVSPAQRPPVFGIIEYTGAYDTVGPIPPDTFDKKQIIDIIKQLRDTVGFIFRVREDGSVQFTPPNIWQSGNYYSDGTRTPEIPVISETLSMTDYIQTSTDQTLRSQIIVSPVDPYLFGGHPNLVTVTSLIPPGIESLRGMVKPAMIGTPLNVPISTEDQNLLAEIQALFCWLGVRTGQVSCAADPAICPDDQIWIYERSTGETNIHYVVGVHTEHDLDTGSWIATYTTQWMGGQSQWAITSSFDSFFGSGAGTGSITDQTFDANGHLIYAKTFTISDTLAKYLANIQSQRTVRFRVNTPGT